MSVSVNMEGHSGTCVFVAKDLLVFFIKKPPPPPVENLLSRIQDLAIPTGGSR
jgi:hypothetical protein